MNCRIIHASASELARHIRARELTAREVVEAHIERARAVDARINALAIPLFERAREDAVAADRAVESGRPLGPLHGVPITIKEQFSVAGTESTIGVRRQRGHVATADGPLVARLRQAGAIILGKTNVAQLLAFIESDNPVYGRSDNPWDPSRTPGGSSGGEAAMIATGASPLGLGSDLGGSIREPAHFCGIHGLKPTSFRLTDLDTRLGLFGRGQEAIVQQAGPLARSVEDLELAMRVLAAPGQERIDPGVAPVPWRDSERVELSSLRVAMYTDDGYFAAAPALRRAVEEAGAALRERGVEVVPWRPPAVDRALHLFFALLTSDGCQSYWRALDGDAPDPRIAPLLTAARLPRVLRRGLAALLRGFGQARVSAVLSSLGKRSTAEFLDLIEARNLYQARFARALDEGCFDAIICPPSGLPALRHGASAELPDFDSYARLFNVLGMPAGTVAATRVRSDEQSDRVPGRDRAERAAAAVEDGSAGLPVGVQVAGRWWREDVVLAVMGALEGHFRGQPDYPDHPGLP